MQLSNKQIKDIHALQQKKFRQETGLFVVEGEKLVEEALHSDFNIHAIYKSSEIGDECMARISSLSTPSPVLAVVEQNKQSEIKAFAASLLKSSNENQKERFPLCLGLDSVKDPGNLGTIIRLADWYGINAIFASEDTVELYNPKTVQATMGAIFRTSVIYCKLAEAVKEFKDAGLPVYGTFLDGSSHNCIKKHGLVIMGSESFGISKEIENLIPAEYKLYIPSYGKDGNMKPRKEFSTSESLNVATATAIICQEFRKA
ncbi:MAG TPA: RNA methyltransferase [Candidatus Egerieousia sp.]|nr:RNA methyltransferase [Candidatus Egerieousia sp.]